MTDIFCNKCLKTKPRSDFYPFCINQNGTGKCKACRKAYCQQWNADHKELNVEYVRKARKRDPERHKLLAQKIYQNMKAKGTR